MADSGQEQQGEATAPSEALTRERHRSSFEKAPSFGHRSIGSGSSVNESPLDQSGENPAGVAHALANLAAPELRHLSPAPAPMTSAAHGQPTTHGGTLHLVPTQTQAQAGDSTSPAWPLPGLGQDSQDQVSISLPPPATRVRSRSRNDLVLAPARSVDEPTPKMLFADLYRSKKSSLSRLRSSQPVPAAADYDPDLVSKDKAKQKEAVKNFLAEKIRNDWDFKWSPKPPVPEKAGLHNGLPTPPPETVSHGSPALGTTTATIDVIDTQPTVPDHTEAQKTSSESDADSVYSTVSEDEAHFRVRVEWLSDLSDDDTPNSPSAYRFDTPDTVGSTVRASTLAKQSKRRRAVRAEEEWNPGLACFNARRDAWTGAKTVRVKAKPQSPPSTTSPTSRRLPFWRLSSPTSSAPPPLSTIATSNSNSNSPVSPTQASASAHSDTAFSSSDMDSKSRTGSSLLRNPNTLSYPVETLIPVAPPLLPPANPMRASITPAVYTSIYDKIILQSLTPACPVNLSDIIHSCVVGWKRDGEWPPRVPDAATTVVAVRKPKKRGSNPTPTSTRRMSFGFLSKRTTGDSVAVAPASKEEGGTAGSKEEEDSANPGKGIRKSLQRVLGIGHERRDSNASQLGAATAAA